MHRDRRRALAATLSSQIAEGFSVAVRLLSGSTRAAPKDLLAIV